MTNSLLVVHVDIAVVPEQLDAFLAATEANAGASRQDLPAYAAFFHAMLDRGVHLPPSAYEAWFLSSAHDERAVQTILDALPAAAGAAARAGGNA